MLEPYYKNYGRRCRPLRRPEGFSGCSSGWRGPRIFRLEPPGRFRAAGHSPRPRGIILNTPNNPSGRGSSTGGGGGAHWGVRDLGGGSFGSFEIEGVAALCLEHDLLAIPPIEIYEHILYVGGPQSHLAHLSRGVNYG